MHTCMYKPILYGFQATRMCSSMINTFMPMYTGSTWNSSRVSACAWIFSEYAESQHEEVVLLAKRCLGNDAGMCRSTFVSDWTRMRGSLCYRAWLKFPRRYIRRDGNSCHCFFAEAGWSSFRLYMCRHETGSTVVWWEDALAWPTDFTSVIPDDFLAAWNSMLHVFTRPSTFVHRVEPRAQILSLQLNPLSFVATDRHRTRHLGKHSPRQVWKRVRLRRRTPFFDLTSSGASREGRACQPS